MKLKVVACGVFEPELRALIAETPHEVELQLLDADDRSAKADASALEARTDADLILDAEIVDGALIGRFALCHWDRPGVGALVVQATGP